MAFKRINGGFWVPNIPPGYGSTVNIIATQDVGLVDADQEEVQCFGTVYLAAGSGSKTFGTSSHIGWLPGASITFNASSTLRVGVKKNSSIDTSNGPPIRATTGGAAFDVYKDLVGGTDTITSTTWRTDAMDSGTPFTVNHGDLICVSFLLSTSGGTPSVKVRGMSAGQMQMPTATLVTSGPTYTGLSQSHDLLLSFDDGTIGWFDGTFMFSQLSSESVGSGNFYGNIFRLPFSAKVDALGGYILGGGSTDYKYGLYSDPLGTPTELANGVLTLDPQLVVGRGVVLTLPTEATLAANTDYALAVSAGTAIWYDVDTADALQANGLDATCYAVKSTSGAAFVQQNSGKRRAEFFMRISQIDFPSAGGMIG